MDLPYTIYNLVGRPFHDMAPVTVAAIATIYFVMFGARGAIGFGALAPAVTLTSWLIPPHQAVLLGLVTATFSQIQLLPEGIRHGDWQVSRPILIATFITIAAGVWLFARLSSEWFALVLGAVMSATVILDMTKVLERTAAVYDLRRPALAFGLSGLAGFLAGLAGGGGMMTIAVYLRYACRDHLTLRATAILIGTALVVWRLIDTAAAGLITRQLVAEAVLLLPAVYIGIWIGAHFFRTMSAARYFTFFRLVLLASALGLVVKGLTRFV